jgi:hypothetical protein
LSFPCVALVSDVQEVRWQHSPRVPAGQLPRSLPATRPLTQDTRGAADRITP